MRRGLAVLVNAALLTGAVPAQAQDEEVIYQYDALGRLVNASTTNGRNGGVVAGTSYDPAGNRTTRTVSGVRPAARRVVVVPLNGFTVIPLKDD
ncbi:RHS repeat domain-containing protein [Sphingomonas sp.]|uniref:RHS repeat domain-containing protein n=1 Tax=Sphingomonas sp. TaxID=28214 RepID=UPI002DD69AF7|nr:RHS repeat domain-containing protein [Sphingomonas sp.]